VAVDGEQGLPGVGLLDNLGGCVVAEQVGEFHVGVADVLAEGHVGGDGRADGVAVEGGVPVGEGEKAGGRAG